MYYKRSGMRLVVATITLVLIFGCGILARPRANAAETTGNTVSVSTVDELLAAIAPGTTIELAAGTYDLSTASDYGGNGTDCYYWAKNVDGPSLVIHDIDGLSIRAMDTASGATTLTAVPRYADVLSFRNCDNLFLEGFTVIRIQRTVGAHKMPFCQLGVLVTCNKLAHYPVISHTFRTFPSLGRGLGQAA